MAKKQISGELERTYVIPLRRYFIRQKYYKRTNRAVSGVKDFLKQHMKASEVKIGKWLNQEIWKHGIQNPPPRVKVNAKRDKDGVVSVELIDLPGKAVRENAKAGKKEEKPAKKAPAKKEEAKKAEPKADVKKAEEKPAKSAEPKPVEKAPEKKEATPEPVKEAEKPAEKKAEPVKEKTPSEPKKE